MPSQWYCKVMDVEIGPLTSQQLRQMAQQKRIKLDDLVRKGDTGSWVRADKVRGLFDAQEAPITATVVPERKGLSTDNVRRGSRSSLGRAVKIGCLATFGIFLFSMVNAIFFAGRPSNSHSSRAC